MDEMTYEELAQRVMQENSDDPFFDICSAYAAIDSMADDGIEYRDMLSRRPDNDKDSY